MYETIQFFLDNVGHVLCMLSTKEIILQQKQGRHTGTSNREAVLLFNWLVMWAGPNLFYSRTIIEEKGR